MTQNEQNIQLSLIHAFGSNTSIALKECIEIIEEDQRQILYPVGRFIALKNLITQEIQFISLPEQLDKLTGIRVSFDQKFLVLCWTHLQDPFPQISLYNIQNSIKQIEKEKNFRHTQTKSTCFQAVTFCGEDSKFLCAATNGPDNQIICLDLERMKIIGSIDIQFNIQRIIVNPKQTNLITVLSQNQIQNYKVKEDIISIQPNINDLNQGQNFIDFCYFDQNILIISNDQGELFIVHKNTVNQKIKNGFNEDHPTPIITVKTFSRGFVVCSKQGQFGLWILAFDQDPEKPQNFIFQRCWKGDKSLLVNDFVIAPKQDIIAICFESNDICTFNIQQILPQNQEVMEIQRQLQFQKKIRYDYLCDGFHSGAITSMDICYHRPIIVTACKQDSTIRIWNYHQFKCDLVCKLYIGDKKSNSELNPLLSVALHPNGYYLAVGFIDKMVVYHLSHKELKMYREINLKNCVQMKFSNGGQYLAVAAQKQKPTHFEITIFNSFSLNFVYRCKGHAALITDLVWSPKDNYFYSCGMDGNLYEWNTLNWARREYIKINAKLGCIALDYNQMIIAGGYIQDKNIIYEYRIANDKNFNLSQQQSPYDNQYIQNYRVTAISNLNQEKSLSGLVLGTADGQIKVFKETYFNKDPLQNFRIHNGGVTKIRLSADGRYLFSGGEDGSIFIFSVKNVDKNQFVEEYMPLQDIDDPLLYNQQTINLMDLGLANVMLVSKNEIKSYMDDQIKLRLQMEDFENKMEIKIQDDKIQREIERQQNREHLKNQIQKWEKKYEDLKVEKTKYERNSEQLIKNIEHNQALVIEEVEHLFEKKLQIQNEKYQNLESSVNEKAIIYQKQFQNQQQKYNENLKFLEQDFNDKFKQSKQFFQNTKNSADDIKKMYDEIMDQQDHEQDYEIQDQIHQNDNEADHIKQQIAELKKQNLLFITDIKINLEDIQRVQKDEIKKINEIEDLSQQLIDQQQKIDSLMQCLEEHRENFKKKEKKIQDQKYIISDLQKSKQVLNFRTQEMHKTLEPKEIEIQQLKDELFNLEAQFENLIKNSKDNNIKMQYIYKIIQQFKSNQLNDLQTQQKNLTLKQDEKLKTQNLNIKQIEMDIYGVVKETDKKNWIQEMDNLYKKYVNAQTTQIQQNDPKGAEEMGNQIIHLEQSIQEIYCSSQKKIFRREQDIRKQMMGNATLIFDLNEVRKKNKTVQGQLNLKLAQINAQTNEIQRLERELSRAKKLDHEKNKQKTRNLSAHPKNNAERFNKIQQQYQQKLFISHGKEISSAKRAQQQKIKGKVFKGANWDAKTLCAFEKARVLDLIVENQSQIQKLQSLDTDYQTVNNAVSRHKIDQGCKIENYEYQEQFQGSIQDESI